MEKYLHKPEHPTGSLEFLKRLKEAQKHNEQQAVVRLKIAIVGAGLGGLSAAVGFARSGHFVTVYEETKVLGEIGAGIQVAPNSSRHLKRWGVEKYMKGLIVEPDAILTRRWETGEVIGKLQFKGMMNETYGAAYYQIHRADFHSALKQAALEHGAKIRTSCKVVDYEFDMPSITLENGEVVEPDLIVAADGVKSIARNKFLGGNEQPGSITGYAVYRGTLDANQVLDIPELKWLVEKPFQNIWIGEDRHIITYTMRSGRMFNFVLLHPEPRKQEDWERDNVGQHMLDMYEGWDPTVLKLISLIKEPTKWPIMATEPLETWAPESGRSIIIGDAVHAMTPWMAQGAAMAIEDSAALAELLRLIPSKEALPQAMKVFQSVRIPRTKQMQHASLLNGWLLHLPDGPEQRARDKGSRREVEGKPFTASSNQWSDPSTQRWAYGYDACEEIRYAWHAFCKGKNPPLKSVL